MHPSAVFASIEATSRDMSTESISGSPASAAKRDMFGNSYLPAIMPKDASQPQYNDESFRSTAPRPDNSREPYRGTDTGMLGSAGYGSGYNPVMENRYMPTINAPPFENSLPRFYPTVSMQGYPGLQSSSLGASHATPISADRQTANELDKQTANEMNMGRAYNTPFALPGLHTAAVTEAQMPPHMEQLAGSTQPLLQLPPPPHPMVSQMREQLQGGGNYGGRVTPTVSLLNDKTVPANRTSPRDPVDASPANSTGPASAPDGIHGKAHAIEGSAGSNGSASHVMRGSSPPIRPIEVSRFPFLSPAIGEGALNRRRTGLTPASLPNILNTMSSSSDNVNPPPDTAALSVPSTSSSKRPSKFSSLHHMVADMNGDSDSEGQRGSSIEEDKSGRPGLPSTAGGKDEQHPEYQKRKRRKLNRGSRAGSEDVDQATPLGKDPISSGFVTESQARELFGM